MLGQDFLSAGYPSCHPTNSVKAMTCLGIIILKKTKNVQTGNFPSYKDKNQC